LSKKSLY